MNKLLKFTMCLAAATLPQVFTLGFINDAQALVNRSDLNGLLLAHPNNNKVYWIDEGKRRWIAGPKAFERNFVLKAVTPISCPALASIPDGRPIR
ncbi:hypothetical protein [Kamptonema sp. UHCC 0994]|uniref:hypothetical protein n=1 Tax=Kamptonema sp. UHCC 0994 TaxID=3031329 RepID=UPI0023B8D3BF|nr:hypothetical protein [Kamptonema sp. UHCC 0994]MDF0554464.1 hypothetical protein [Kamptonema sp. UHCC 0994]